MLNNQTVEKLRSMKLPALAAEYVRQLETPNMDALTLDERMGMLADSDRKIAAARSLRRFSQSEKS